MLSSLALEEEDGVHRASDADGPGTSSRMSLPCRFAVVVVQQVWHFVVIGQLLELAEVKVVVGVPVAPFLGASLDLGQRVNNDQLRVVGLINPPLDCFSCRLIHARPARVSMVRRSGEGLPPSKFAKRFLGVRVVF